MQTPDYIMLNYKLMMLNLEDIVVNFHPLLMLLFLSGHFLVVLPHQLFCLLVEKCVHFVLQQNMNKAIYSFVDFAIHKGGVVF